MSNNILRNNITRNNIFQFFYREDNYTVGLYKIYDIECLFLCFYGWPSVILRLSFEFFHRKLLEFLRHERKIAVKTLQHIFTNLEITLHFPYGSHRLPDIIASEHRNESMHSIITINRVIRQTAGSGVKRLPRACHRAVGVRASSSACVYKRPINLPREDDPL